MNGREIGSVLSHVPLISDIESKFDIEYAKKWLDDNIGVAVAICIVYVAAIYVGRALMATREPFRLRRTMLIWNVGLAAFSVYGMISSVPGLVYSIYHNGMTYSCCHSILMTDRQVGLWSILFILSKPVELGDTIFIVLRKTPLNFLHWYHHVTVLLYSWFSASRGAALGHWFGAMNFTVHSIMYTYYAIRASGIRVPSVVARTITGLQLSQMFVGLMVCLIAFNARNSNISCNIAYSVIYYGLIVYGSYFVLFANFYYQRYCHSKKD